MPGVFLDVRTQRAHKSHCDVFSLPCRFECTHNYTQMHEIPFGNPWHGGKWHGTPGKDTGSYVGGTEFR